MTLSNRTPPLQVQRVEHRVSTKKSTAVRLEQELSHAQLMACRGAKRRTGSSQMPVSHIALFLVVPLQISLWCTWREDRVQFRLWG